MLQLRTLSWEMMISLRITWKKSLMKQENKIQCTILRLSTLLSGIIFMLNVIYSPYFIFYCYLYRLLDCMNRALQKPFEKGFCPFIFDSWSCFNATLPGQTQLEHCPDFINLGFNKARTAEKMCLETGEWWVHPETNKSWTNYTSCLDLADVDFRQTINKITHGVLRAFMLFSKIRTRVNNSPWKKKFSWETGWWKQNHWLCHFWAIAVWKKYHFVLKIDELGRKFVNWRRHGSGITVIKMTRVFDFVALKAYLEKLHCVVKCLIAAGLFKCSTFRLKAHFITTFIFFSSRKFLKQT